MATDCMISMFVQGGPRTNTKICKSPQIAAVVGETVCSCIARGQCDWKWWFFDRGSPTLVVRMN